LSFRLREEVQYYEQQALSATLKSSQTTKEYEGTIETQADCRRVLQFNFGNLAARNADFLKDSKALP